MIRYSLRCATGHGFEGWFRDSATYEAQARDGQLACPECGTTTVDRALMTPALARRAEMPAPVPVPSAAVATPMPTRAVMPDGVRAALQRLRAEVERTSEHVGPDFAEQALAMHRGEIEHRSIHGDATEAERERLADEGVEVAVIPWVARADG